MHYEAEYQFFKRILKNRHINTTPVWTGQNTFPEFDLGLRHMLYNAEDYGRFYDSFQKLNTADTIFRIQDEYLCSYIFFAFPNAVTENAPSLFIIGPYTTREITKQMLLNLAEGLSISPHQFTQLTKYYSDIPILGNEEELFSLVTTFGEYLWGSPDNFTVEYMDKFGMSDNLEPVASRPDYREPEDAFLSMKSLESRYACENSLIHAVSQGLIHKAEVAFSGNSVLSLEKRLSDPVRDIKNYCIIMNALLRKGAEQGDVHPIHIDNLSSRFARKIEQITSYEAGITLQKEMIHKYCLLVKNHSMKGFSLLIQKVITRIDSDLTADLSLKTQAKLLNVNASYLSTLFKKETDMTLTDYVNKKRIDNAVFLLNSTKMQIQTIAQYCGIPDVNYFTKLFKKYIGKTPKEYRGEIS